MAGISTFTMIKPDAFEAGYTGLILQKFIENGFKIKALRLTHLHKEDAEAFYAIHKERPFFNSLVAFMSSGTIVAAVLEKENAVEDFRKLIGSTNPTEAADGTVRKLFASSIEKNAVHGSDSDENAQIEANFFFSHFDRP
jgi:nucleoside-diphosphate kinase